MVAFNKMRARLLAGAVVALAATGLTFTETRQADAQTTQRGAPPPPDPIRVCEPFTNNQLRNSDRTETETIRSQIALIRESEGQPPEQNAFIERTVRTALATCSDSRRNNRNRLNLHAYRCVAMAHERLSRLNASERQSNLEQTYCNYGVVARLNGTPNNLLGEAHEARGQVLTSLRDTGYSGASPADLRTAARREFEAAVARDPSASRQLALGVALATAEDYPGAEYQLRAAARSASPSDARLTLRIALALVDLGTRTNNSQLLDEANRLSPGSLSVNAARGIALFRNNQYTAAYAPLQAATLATPSPGEGEDAVRYRAQAYYYLAMIEATDRANWRYAADNATNMAASGISDHHRLVCLAHVRLGGRYVYIIERDRQNISPDGARVCSSATLGNSADANLLRGLFHLRVAQHIPNVTLRSPNYRTWREQVDFARNAFQEGALSSPGQQLLQWPELPQSDRPQLSELFRAGLNIASYVDRFCEQSATAPSGPGASFHYRILGGGSPCRA